MHKSACGLKGKMAHVTIKNVTVMILPGREKTLAGRADNCNTSILWTKETTTTTIIIIAAIAMILMIMRSKRGWYWDENENMKKVISES